VTKSAPITLRLAAPADGHALRRLAELDSADPLAGIVLVAAIDGEVLAALSVPERRAIANPFRHTAELVALLQVRAGQLSDRAGAPRRGALALRIRHGWRPAVKPSPRSGRAVA
jgi:hypothetical protein